ncbi:methylglyoxal synthase, partial [Pseudanabaenaceae cyanobacterium LEGE 13415]|nr:methylglyoxal synthase [Pseudanabaenaceae cyanobacterium LEGE 13415]
MAIGLSAAVKIKPFGFGKTKVFCNSECVDSRIALMPNTIAFIAHNTRKDEMVRFVTAHQPTFGRYHLIGTARTAEQLQAATGLEIEQRLAHSLGGTVQIAGEVASGNILAVIALVDPDAETEPNFIALFRLCNLYNVAIATNLATAEAIVTRLAKT